MTDPIREQRLRQTLQEIAQRDVPATLDLRAAVRARLQTVPAPARLRPTGVPWGHVLLVTGLLLALLAVGLGPLVGDTLPFVGNAPGGPATPPTGRVPLSQTVQGYTVTLDQGLMDANWTVLTYTLSSRSRSVVGIVPGRWTGSTYAGPRLTTAQGTDLALLSPLFRQFENTDLAPWNSVITTTQLAFRTDSLGDGSVRNLHLELNLAQLQPESSTPTGPWWQLPTVPVAGPFAFDLAVPVNREARMADIGQTVTAGTTALTLERVIVTGTETRIFLRPTSPGSDPGASWGTSNYAADATLQIGTWSSSPQDGYGRISWDGTSWVYTYIGGSLLDNVGDWTLTMADVPNPPASPLSGPWTFHFTLPPAETVPPPAVVPVPSAPVPLTQTVLGHTLTLYPAVADTNQIVFTYTLTSPQGEQITGNSLSSYVTGAPQLTDDSGNTYPSLTTQTYSWQPKPDDLDPTSSAIVPTNAAMIPFDVTGILAPPPVANLHLTIPIKVRDATTQAEHEIHFDFALRLPLDLTRRVATLQQSVTVGGRTVTLEQVRVTRSEVGLILRVTPPGTGMSAGPLPTGLTLSAADWSSLTYNEWGQGPDGLERPDGTRFFRVFNNLLTKEGEWTLTVPRLQQWDAQQPQPTTLSGPWVFHFTLPPATDH